MLCGGRCVFAIWYEHHLSHSVLLKAKTAGQSNQSDLFVPEISGYQINGVNGLYSNPPRSRWETSNLFVCMSVSDIRFCSSESGSRHNQIQNGFLILF